MASPELTLAAAQVLSEAQAEAEAAQEPAPAAVAARDADQRSDAAPDEQLQPFHEAGAARLSAVASVSDPSAVSA